MCRLCCATVWPLWHTLMGTYGFVYGSPRTNTSSNIQHVTCWDFLKTPRKLLSCDATQTGKFLDKDPHWRTLIFHTRPAGVHKMSLSHLVSPHPSCWTCRNQYKHSFRGPRRSLHGNVTEQLFIWTCTCAALHVHLRKNLKKHICTVIITLIIYIEPDPSKVICEPVAPPGWKIFRSWAYICVIKQDFPPTSLNLSLSCCLIPAKLSMRFS